MEISVETDVADLQGVIDQLIAAGGGRLLLEPGWHVAGPLRLGSGVTLVIQEGATLEFTPNYEYYASNSVSVIAEASDRAYITAQNARDIAIVGKGRILGAGHAFRTGFDESVGTFTPSEKRPRILVLEDCRNVRLEGVFIEDSPMWTVHLVRCETVAISDVEISNNRQLPNTDGVVIDSCRHVTIRDVIIRTADDGICLKTSRSDRGISICENVEISGCVVESKSCALKIGTESFGDVRNVRFSRSKVEASNRGLGIFSRDGGIIEDIVFSDIELDCHETPDGFWGSGEPLTITQLDRRPELPAGVVRNVTAENIKGRCHGAINLFAEKAGGIDGIILHNIDLTMDEGPLGTARQYDLRPTNADLAPPEGAEGRGNAWLRGADGKILGLVDYPGGLPGVFTHNVTHLVMEEVAIERPTPLPAGWNSLDIVSE
ncbi:MULTISPECIES: glycoside hydrolase family 28 protein [unclassified Sinorhizobium]|uniref:polygalacturonase PglB n=1 Tax=unclassified Sinorhizobium TaxID=2613772 RepID=UPI003524AC18